MVFRTSIILNKRINELEDSNDQPSALKAYYDLKKKLLRSQDLFKSRLEKIIAKKNEELKNEKGDGGVEINYSGFLGLKKEEKADDLFLGLKDSSFYFQSVFITNLYQKFQDLLKKSEDFFYQESALKQLKPELKNLIFSINETIDDSIDQNKLLIEKIKLERIILTNFKVERNELNLEKKKGQSFSKITRIINETLSLLMFLQKEEKKTEINSQYFNLSIKKIIDYWEFYQDSEKKLSSEFKNILDEDLQITFNKRISKFGLEFRKNSFGFCLYYSGKNETFIISNINEKVLLKFKNSKNLNELVDLIDSEITYIPYFKRTLNFYQKSQFKQKVLASILRTQNPTSTRKIINNLPILDIEFKKILAEKITIFKKDQVKKQQKRMLMEKTSQLLNKISDFFQTQETLIIGFENFKNKMVDKNKFNEDDKTMTKELYHQLKKDYQKQEIEYVNLLLTLNNLNLENPELIKRSNQLIEVEQKLNSFKIILKSFDGFF
jgi:uncharacterized protein (DUF433 family)